MQVLRQPTADLLSHFSQDEAVDLVYSAAKICYQNEPERIETADKIEFLQRLLKRGHTSPFEHVSISMVLTTDRGVSHELVRHRIGAYNQESTRYCNYDKQKFGSEIKVMMPIEMQYAEEAEQMYWRMACQASEDAYILLIRNGVTPESARSILPTCLATQLIVTYDIPMWRHVLVQRLDPHAHPDMRYLMQKCFEELNRIYPAFFRDLFHNYYEHSKRSMPWES